MQIRYALYARRDKLVKTFDADAGSSVPFEARYNISAGDTVPAVVSFHPGKRTFEPMRWIEGNKSADTPGESCYLEDVLETPELKKIFQRQRCIIPASGFFLWQKMYEKQVPFYIRSIEEDVIGFAGIYWENEEASGIAGRFSLISIQANPLIQPIQDHMPAILSYDQYSRWLDPVYSDTKQLTGLLTPYSTERMSVYRVSDGINDPDKNDKELIQPVDA